MNGHYTRECEVHGTRLGTCRCMGPKTVQKVPCPGSPMCPRSATITSGSVAEESDIEAPDTINQMTQEATTMSVEARFFIHTFEGQRNNEGELIGKVTLKACTRKDADNVSWTKWTPTGEMTMQINNPGAAEFFHAHIGRDVRITIALDEDERVYQYQHQSEADYERIAEAAKVV